MAFWSKPLIKVAQFFVLVVPLWSHAESGPGTLVLLELSGLGEASGDLYIAVYDTEASWLGDDTYLDKKVAIADALEGDLVRTEVVLPPGEYAVSIFHDRNNNGELDTNFIGMPKEPIAMSNNARPKFGPPKYEDAVFSVGDEQVTQKIIMNEL